MQQDLRTWGTFWLAVFKIWWSGLGFEPRLIPVASPILGIVLAVASAIVQEEFRPWVLLTGGALIALGLISFLVVTPYRVYRRDIDEAKRELDTLDADTQALRTLRMVQANEWAKWVQVRVQSIKLDGLKDETTPYVEVVFEVINGLVSTLEVARCSIHEWKVMGNRLPQVLDRDCRVRIDAGLTGQSKAIKIDLAANREIVGALKALADDRREARWELDCTWEVAFDGRSERLDRADRRELQHINHPADFGLRS